MNESTHSVQFGALPTVTVIVPAYNEGQILRSTLETLAAYLTSESANFTGSILVVNDGSTDETGQIADEFALRDCRIRVLHHRVNFRLGQALRYAFGQCNTDYLVTIDSDLSYSVDHIGRLVEHINRTKAKIVIASPYADGGNVGHVPWLRKVLSRWANRYLSVGAKGEISTLTGMVRAYDGRFMASLDLSATGVDINTEIIYKARILNARIDEIPAVLSWTTDDRRSSKFRLANSIKLYILSGFLFRPLLTLLLPAFLFFITGSVAFLSVVGGSISRKESIVESFNGSPVTLGVAAVSFVFSLQFLTLALLAWQAKRNFEHLFHLGTTNLRATQDLRREIQASQS